MPRIVSEKYLELLQKQLHLATGTKPQTLAATEAVMPADFFNEGMRQLGIEDIEAARSQYWKELEETETAKPSKYESVTVYRTMEMLAVQIEAAARTWGLPAPVLPVYGSLPIGQLNARAIRVPHSTECLIVFQHGVLGFANLLAKAVAASFPHKEADKEGMVRFSGDVDDIVDGWRNNKEPLGRFADLLISYVTQGDPHKAAQYFLGQPFAALADVLRDSFELFIFGHEFGHVIAEHLETQSSAGVRVGEVELETLEANWNMEFEADYIGFVLTMLAMREQRFDAALSYCGIDLFFSAVEVLERAVSILVHGEAKASAPSDTHPPPELRRKALRDHLGKICDEESAAGARSLAETSQQILDLMWERTEPAFERLHADGVRPSIIWVP